DDGKGQKGQDAGGQQSDSSNSGPSSRVEAAMLAYDASDLIAKHIASKVKGSTLIIYDNQTFSSLQAYEAYTATLATLERALQMGRIQGLDGGTLASTVVSTLAALRSATDYANQAVDFNQDALIAQVAQHLTSDASTHVIVPKILLLNPDDLQWPKDQKPDLQNCSEIKKIVPQQLACLLNVRNQHNDVPTYVDKLLQL